MTNSTGSMTDAALVVDRYLAVWSEPDPELRRRAIAALWAKDGAEFVEGIRFQGLDELDARIAEAYQAFVGSGTYTVASAGDAAGHHDMVTFTIQLIFNDGDHAGEVAWAARVFIVLADDDLIREDYQLTIQPLAA